MQNILITIILLPLISLAGTPEQDPVVAQVRADLVKSRTPVVSELRLGFKWKCLDLSAGNNYFIQKYFVISFESFDGIIRPFFWEVDGNRKWPDTDQLMGGMVKTTTGMIGRCNVLNCPDTFLLRFDSINSKLIFENSFPLDDYNGSVGNYPTTSIFNSNNNAIEYYVCPTDQILP